VKLFSVTAAMSNGCDISNNGLSLVIQKNELKIEFDQIIKTVNGYICGIELNVKTATKQAYATINMKKGLT